MGNRIMEIVELGKPQSIIQRDGNPITELIQTHILIEELNEQLLLYGVSTFKIMETYRNWKIEKADYGYYEATNLNDCDAFMKHSKSVDELKLEIDDE